MSASSVVPTLLPDERPDILSLLDAAARPLADVVADFLARFPRERRLRVCGALCFLLEASYATPRLSLFPSFPLAEPPSSFSLACFPFVRIGRGLWRRDTDRGLA
jgi:hypothetical protein